MSSPELDDAAIAGFLDAAFDFVCTRPLSDLMDPEKILPALDEALKPERVKDFQTRVGRPVRERLLERADKSALTMRAWLPKDVADRLDEQLGHPAKVPQTIIDDVVASEKVRDAVRAMLSEALTNFVAKATGGDTAAGQGIRGALGFAKAAGKGLLGGLGEEIQKRMQERVKDFVDASVASVQRRIAERLSSDETAKALGKRRQEAFRKFLDTPEPKAAKAIRGSDPDAIDREVPHVVAHNLAREEVRTALREELTLVVAELSKESIGVHLERAGIQEHARAAVRAHGVALGRAFVSTPAFQAWRGSLGH
jgi:hypothetical protein